MRCPYCGSTYILSLGKERLCGACGQRWQARFIRWLMEVIA